jgi:hypothetical protein
MPFPERILEPASQVVSWLADDFNGSSIDTDQWSVSGSPSVSSSELTIPSGAALQSKQHFQPPCLVEVVCTMTARAGTDDFRIGFYTNDDNLVEWRAAGSTGSNMDAVMRAAGVDSNQSGINVNAANNSYRMASIYVGIGEVIWSFRTLGGITVRNEVYRLVEQGIPDGPFRVRLAGLAGTSSLKVHRVQAYQLADLMPVGALGHHVDGLAIPVRVTNGPWVGSPSSPGLTTLGSSVDTFASLAAGAVGTGSNRSFHTEHCHIQAHFMGDQPFAWWVEAQADGTNWQVVDYGTSVDATTDAVVRYFGRSAILQLHGGRTVRVKVRNNGTAAGTFRGTLIATSL